MNIIGDIGGSKARFALVDKKDGICCRQTYYKAEFENISEALRRFMQYNNLRGGRALLAVNAPVVNGLPAKKSNDWGYNPEKIKAETNLKDISFINDGIAHAMAIPWLRREDIFPLYPADSEAQGTIVSVSIGTEVGVAYGIYNSARGRYDFYPSEGGSQFFSPASPGHIEILCRILETNTSLAWNHLTSGSGISRLYNLLYNDNCSASEIMSAQFENGRFYKVFEIFGELLGAFIHNIACMLLPFGGIYLTGGVLSRPEVLSRLRQTPFKHFYELGTPADSPLRRLPVRIVSNDSSALIGLAHCF